MKQLEGKTVLITGGSRGIGAAIAQRLAQEGAQIALTYKTSPEKAAGIVKAIEAQNGKAIAIQADSADPRAIADAVVTTVKELGGLDILMELQQTAPQLKTIVLSSFDEEETVVHALSFGKAMNYIPKRHYRDLPASIRQLVHHGSGLHPSAASRVLQHLSMSGKQQIRRRVTDRQLAILRMLDQGMNRRDIAAALFYTEQSVNNELCKVSTLLKGTFPYLQWLRLKKHNTAEILQLARQLELLP